MIIPDPNPRKTFRIRIRNPDQNSRLTEMCLWTKDPDTGDPKRPDPPDPDPEHWRLLNIMKWKYFYRNQLTLK